MALKHFSRTFPFFPPFSSCQANQYWVFYTVMATPYFWLTLVLVPIVALLPDFLYNG